MKKLVNLVLLLALVVVSSFALQGLPVRAYQYYKNIWRFIYV